MWILNDKAGCRRAGGAVGAYTVLMGGLARLWRLVLTRQHLRWGTPPADRHVSRPDADYVMSELKLYMRAWSRITP